MPYTSDPIDLPLYDTGVPFARADLILHDVDHRGATYEGRIYLNNPSADASTPPDRGDGYAGSFYIFGHPHCWGDEGHCQVPPGPLHGYDDRPPHHLLPYTINVDVTEAIRALTDGTAESTCQVTILPLVRTGLERRVADDELRFSHLSLVTYD
jgi:tyrosinase